MTNVAPARPLSGAQHPSPDWRVRSEIPDWSSANGLRDTAILAAFPSIRRALMQLCAQVILRSNPRVPDLWSASPSPERRWGQVSVAGFAPRQTHRSILAQRTRVLGSSKQRSLCWTASGAFGIAPRASAAVVPTGSNSTAARRSRSGAQRLVRPPLLISLCYRASRWHPDWFPHGPPERNVMSQNFILILWLWRHKLWLVLRPDRPQRNAECWEL